MIKISYLIGTHNEGEAYLDRLFSVITSHMEEGDELIVVDDNSTDESTLRTFEKYKNKITALYDHQVNGDFASHKNFMNSKCSGDYILNLDGDEIVPPSLLLTLKEILLNNPDVDLFYVPRINIVKGITDEDIKAYGWQINDKGWINFPDAQGRLYKNRSDIKWEGKVHERISSNTYSMLPYQNENGELVTDYCILHIKDIERQRRQNYEYEKIK